MSRTLRSYVCGERGARTMRVVHRPDLLQEEEEE